MIVSQTDMDYIHRLGKAVKIFFQFYNKIEANLETHKQNKFVFHISETSKVQDKFSCYTMIYI